VRGDESLACPECAGRDLERLFSLPTVQSSGTRGLAMKAAKARDKRQGDDRTRAQREYELSHDD